MLQIVVLTLLPAIVLFGQNSSTQPSNGFKHRTAAAGPTATAAGTSYQVDAGTHVLLSMINSVSTKQAQVGDRIYLQTAFPVVVNGKIVIPQGSWVNGTVTSVQRPGHMKQKGELQVRFDSLTLANGTTRDFHSDLGAVDSDSGEKLDREHSGVVAPSDRGKRAGTVATTAGTGAAVGAGVGAIGHSAVGGALIGGAAGTAAGLIGTMLAGRPDAVLPKGTTVEMVLDRAITFSSEEVQPAQGR